MDFETARGNFKFEQALPKDRCPAVVRHLRPPNLSPHFQGHEVIELLHEVALSYSNFNFHFNFKLMLESRAPLHNQLNAITQL